MTRRIVSFEPYGCTMNHGEARLAGQMLEEIGYEVRPPKGGLADPSSDIVLLFTCDVIETTQRRMWRRMEEITRDGKDLVVAGCLASIDGDRILERYPEAKILGSMGVPELCSSMNDLFSTGTAPGIDHPGPDGRMDTIVPIANGCLGSCSYCITRVARGPLRSYPVDKIIGRIRKGVLSGRKEVLLTSQDTGVYGLDIGGIDLGGLLSRITSSVRKHLRIRVGMMNPLHISERMDSILSGFDDERIFKFFHIPVQSGSRDILERMNRGYTPEDFGNIVSSIRGRFPGAMLSTDVIVGFPGEREEDLDMTISLLKKVRPEVLNITRFSERPGTPAVMMANKIKGGEMKERSRRMSRLHDQITSIRLDERIGFHPSCLVTEVGRNGTMMARDENNIPIVVKGEHKLLGSFVDIVSEKSGPTYLIGKVQ